MKVLSPAAHAYLNSKELLAERDLWFSRMSAIFDGRQDDYNDKKVLVLRGTALRPTDVDPYTDPEGWVLGCLEQMAAHKPTDENRFAPMCLSHSIYGVHFVDKLLGANVRLARGQWHTDYLKTPIGSLEMPDLEKDETWQITKRAVKAFCDADVSVPLYGTSVLASSLNILVNLYGQEALMAMYEDPDAVHHDMGVINDLIRFLHRWYRENLPKAQFQPCAPWSRAQPQGYGQLCGCTCQLLGTDLYREFAAPLDSAVLDEYENGGMIHLCGAHTQHLETFRNMKKLRAVQLNDRAAEELELYFNGLRDDQIIYIDPCPGMPVERIMEITGGNRIVLSGGMLPPDKP